MSNLVLLMKALGADAALADEYERDTEAVIRRFNLSDAERKALLAGDLPAIRKLTGLSDGIYATNSTVKVYDSRD